MQFKSAPVEKTFTLATDEDQTNPGKITIRQATFAESAKRGELFAKRTQVFGDVDQGDAYKVEQEWNPYEIQATEIALTISGAENFKDADGNERFRFKNRNGKNTLDMSSPEFRAVLGDMTDEMVQEIHERVLQVNPQWDNKKRIN